MPFVGTSTLVIVLAASPFYWRRTIRCAMSLVVISETRSLPM
jgi:hypothetical protein